MEEAGAKTLISCLGLTSLVDYLLLETSLLRSISQTSCISSLQNLGRLTILR